MMHCNNRSNIAKIHGFLWRRLDKNVDRRLASSTQNEFRSTDLEQIDCFTSFKSIIDEVCQSTTDQKAVLTDKTYTDE